MSICDIGFRTTMSKRVRGVKNISAIGLDQTRPSGILSRGLSSVVFAPFIVIISQWSKSVTHVYTSKGLALGGLNLYYSGVIMDPMASQITGISIVYWIVCSGADQRKYQSSTLLAFAREIHWWPVNCPHKGPVTRKIFPFDDVLI